MVGIAIDLVRKSGDHTRVWSSGGLRVVPDIFRQDNIAGPHGTFFRTATKIEYLKNPAQST